LNCGRSGHEDNHEEGEVADGLFGEHCLDCFFDYFLMLEIFCCSSAINCDWTVSPFLPTFLPFQLFSTRANRLFLTL
jgi:hypothetical protein